MENEFKIIPTDRWGHMICRDGSLFCEVGDGTQPFTATFSDLDSARRFSESLVRELPHVECTIYNSKEAVVLRHYDHEWHRQEEDRIRKLFARQRRIDRIVLCAAAGVLITIITAVAMWLS